MANDAYRAKRRPGKTPEPFADSAAASTAAGEAPIFVVQRHRARRLHYDLRLERGGALASWAVPKGVPLERGARHLAVHVEDHPLAYATFAGVIPEGEYGAGTVELWDTGTYELLEEKRDGGLTVQLHGGRLRGVWTLVPAGLDGKAENWLLMRKDDGPPRHAWSPMLCSQATSPPRGAAWTFEPKWDGYRALVEVRGGELRLRSRRGLDLGARWPALLPGILTAVRSPDAVLDGEICALDDRGRSRFELLQRGGGTLVLVVFDLLELDGQVLVDQPLSVRRELLAGVVDPSAGPVIVSPVFDDGAALLAVARAEELEGIVAKRAASPYRPGVRHDDWRKLKTRNRDHLVVVGWQRGSGRLSRTVGSLHVAADVDGELRYAGSVGSGLTDDLREALLERLAPLARSDAPVHDPPQLTRAERSVLTWVDPELGVEVAYTELTAAGRLRQPVLLGVDGLLPASGVEGDRGSVGGAAPVAADETPSEPERLVFPPELRRGRRVLRFSNLDKAFWPAEGITKGGLLAFYRDIAPVLVPHLRCRPFTMKRYPDGWQGKSFFQKNAPSHMPDWIRRVPLPATTRDGETRTIEYAVLDDDLALLWAVSMGCIDLHAGAARVDRLERPDWVVFDLDPADGTPFGSVVEVALLVRELLTAVGLEGVAKTSGSRGIHVLVPIARRHTHAQARSFAEIVAGALARAHPTLVTTEWARAKRHGVLVDVNQNGQGRTTAMGYSVRPRAGAPVSTPLRWDEVTPSLDPQTFTMDAVLRRVHEHGDLLAPALHGGQSLTAALRAVGG